MMNMTAFRQNAFNEGMAAARRKERRFRVAYVLGIAVAAVAGAVGAQAIDPPHFTITSDDTYERALATCPTVTADTVPEDTQMQRYCMLYLQGRVDGLESTL